MEIDKIKNCKYRAIKINKNHVKYKSDLGKGTQKNKDVKSFKALRS